MLKSLVLNMSDRSRSFLECGQCFPILFFRTLATWAGKFLREWCQRANQSQIEPMQKLAATLTKHESLLLNWFESQGLSSGVVEGFNNKAKLTMRKAYGFKEFETIQTALFHQLEKLPEPKTTHRFC